MAPTPAASNKRPAPYEGQPEAKRRREGPAQRAYDDIVTRDNARAHFGDSIQHIEYHAAVHHYSDRVQITETTPRVSATRTELL